MPGIRQIFSRPGCPDTRLPLPRELWERLSCQVLPTALSCCLIGYMESIVQSSERPILLQKSIQSELRPSARTLLPSTATSSKPARPGSVVSRRETGAARLSECQSGRSSWPWDCRIWWVPCRVLGSSLLAASRRVVGLSLPLQVFLISCHRQFLPLCGGLW